uniref:Vasohibin-like protein n=1 Tax=Ciona savignyi TaxID=51511 RepID=H2YLS2_CIOSA
MAHKHDACIQEEVESDDDNIPFYINKNGFPIDEKTWERLWRYAGKIYPDAKNEIEEIKNSPNLMDVSTPTIPQFQPRLSTSQSLKQIQNYISSLQYNHTGTQLFEIRKSRPLAGLMDKAKEMIKEALPIKCLEAVILAIYLTNGISNLDRFPIGFKSVFNGHRYYHVVLGVFHNGKYGALGLSRRKDLMDKPLVFKSLYDLTESYNEAYSKYNHQLRKIRIGGIVHHDMCSQEKIQWGILSVGYGRTNGVDRQRQMDRYSREIRSHFTYMLPSAPTKERSRPSPLLRREPTGFLQNSEKSQTAKRTSKSAVLIRKAVELPDNYHVRV